MRWAILITVARLYWRLAARLNHAGGVVFLQAYSHAGWRFRRRVEDMVETIGQAAKGVVFGLYSGRKSKGTLWNSGNAIQTVRS